MKAILKNLSLFFILFTTNFFAQTADFSASTFTVCGSAIVSFSDLSSGSPTSWNWDFGNGNSSPLQNPVQTYNTPGNYVVKLTVSGGNSIQKTIIVSALPSTSFNLNPSVACIGRPVLFTSNSTAPGSSISNYSWDFGTGSTSITTVPSVSFTYVNPGNYNVSLNVTNAFGCSKNVVVPVQVLDVPTALFSASPVFACAPPLNVNFTNNSTTGAGVTYLWDFGDGNTSTLQSPSKIYSTTGSFSPTLTVSRGGCSSSFNLLNNILVQSISPDFSTSTATVCAGQSVNFNNLSVPSATASSWNFGDGNTSTANSPSNTFANQGSYTVLLNATDANGCAGTKSKIITVNPSPIVVFSAPTTTVCSVPFNANFNNASTLGNTYDWDFGDGGTSSAQNSNHTYTSSGVYAVTLKVTSDKGCSITLTKPSYINISLPVANFTTNIDSGCVALPITFTSTSTSLNDPITNYSWNFGNGSSGTGITASTIYAVDGVYTPTLTVTTATGCKATYTCDGCIRAGIKPTSVFQLTAPSRTVCYGTVNFTNTSTPGTYTGWQWNFGSAPDATPPTGKDPESDFRWRAGPYFVTLTIYNKGCVDDTIIPFWVKGPRPSWTKTPLNCASPNTYTFNGTVLPTSVPPNDYTQWSFGDGTFSPLNVLNVSHTYSISGRVLVGFTAFEQASNCTITDTASILITRPIASFTNTAAGCYPFNPNFINNSQDAVSNNWVFGDGTTSTDVNPAKTYTISNLAPYTVSLTITDANNCKRTATATVRVNGPVVTSINPNKITGCRPLLVNFTESSVLTKPITNRNWDFGDGSPSFTTTLASAAHTYTNIGTFNVNLIVTDQDNCTGSFTFSSIKPTFPDPKFAANAVVCKDQTVNFDGSGTVTEGTSTYRWNFGDASPAFTFTSPVTATTHTYSNFGIYTVTLTVTDLNSCVSTFTNNVAVLTPTASINITPSKDVCNAFETQLSNTLIPTYFLDSWNYKWDFGNGGSGSGSSVSVNYYKPGTYVVKNVVTNSGGCKDSITKTITVKGPVGSFTFSPKEGCNPLVVSFKGTSSNATSFRWDFDDKGRGSIGATTTYTYEEEGTYNPKMDLVTIVDGLDCSYPADNLTGLVVVTNSIVIDWLPKPIAIQEDSSRQISVTVSNGVLPYQSYNWLDNKNLSCDDCLNPVIKSIGEPVTYTFTVVDAKGCTKRAYILVNTIYCDNDSILFPNVFSPNGDGVNDLYKIPGVCKGNPYSLNIFNRWGELVCDKEALKNNTWDGKTISGKDASAGTYFLIVSLLDNKTNSNRTYKYPIQLFR
ncbi:MAG: PKD domain-containing protein [Bacteroidota bacterium]